MYEHVSGVVQSGIWLCTHFPKQPQDLETSIIDLQLRRARKTAHAIGEGVYEVEKVLRHCDSRSGLLFSFLLRIVSSNEASSSRCIAPATLSY